MPEVEDNPIPARLEEIVGLLLQLVSQERPSPKRLLRLKEAARYISVSVWKLRGLIQGGEIPIVRNGDGAGGVWLVDVQDLNAWIEHSKINL